MKKLIAALLAFALCLVFVACGAETPVSTASDAEKQTVINAANKCLNSAAFNDYLNLYASLFGEERSVPEITDALVYSCTDFEGLAVEAIFFRVDANVAFMEGTSCVNNDHIIFAVDTAGGAVYDSITHGADLNAFNGTVTTVEEAIFACMNSPTVTDGADGLLWTETETATRFSPADIKDLNTALSK